MSGFRDKTRRNGFTLIEVMAAVAVLAIIVVFMARVFSESSKVWKLGNKRVESNNSGRAAIDFVASEIASAIVNGGGLAIQKNETSPKIYGDKSDVVAFIASSGTPSDVNDPGNGRNYVTRQIKQSCFKVIQTNTAGNGPYFLAYHNEFSTKSMKDPFTGTAWISGLISGTTPDKSSVIAENVRDFEVFVYDQQAQPIRTDPYQSWASTNAIAIPLFIDVYLEVFGQEDAIKASLGATNYPAMTRRFSTRVFMPNVQGFARDQ